MIFIRMLHALFATLWLATPVLVLNFLSNVQHRLLVFIVFLVALALATATMERVRKYEILISVATYVNPLLAYHSTRLLT
jgi:hypothetical protein